MNRQLESRKQKLLYDTDFILWKFTHDLYEAKIMKKYCITKRDYDVYNDQARFIRESTRKIKALKPEVPFKTKGSAALLELLYMLGMVPTQQDLNLAEMVSVASFCRRRLAVFLVINKMAENVETATKLVEQGHVRVGRNVITNPAFRVMKYMEDLVTLVDSSAIKKPGL